MPRPPASAPAPGTAAPAAAPAAPLPPPPPPAGSCCGPSSCSIRRTASWPCKSPATPAADSPESPGESSPPGSWARKKSREWGRRRQGEQGGDVAVGSKNGETGFTSDVPVEKKNASKAFEVFHCKPAPPSLREMNSALGFSPDKKAESFKVVWFLSLKLRPVHFCHVHFVHRTFSIYRKGWPSENQTYCVAIHPQAARRTIPQVQLRPPPSCCGFAVATLYGRNDRACLVFYCLTGSISVPS